MVRYSGTLNPSIKIHYDDPAIKVTLTYDRKELIGISALMIIYSLLNIKRVKIPARALILSQSQS